MAKERGFGTGLVVGMAIMGAVLWVLTSKKGREFCESWGCLCGCDSGGCGCDGCDCDESTDSKIEKTRSDIEAGMEKLNRMAADPEGKVS